MSCVLTYSGRLVDVLHLQAQDVHLEDIAHGLAGIGRWQGVFGFWDVMRHSLAVSYFLLETGARTKTALAGLLHDGSEAYLGDVPSPIKHLDALAGYRALEAHVQGIVYHVLTGHVPDAEQAAVIARADLAVAKAEVIMLGDGCHRVVLKAPSFTAVTPSDLSRAATALDQARIKKPGDFIAQYNKLAGNLAA